MLINEIDKGYEKNQICLIINFIINFIYIINNLLI